MSKISIELKDAKWLINGKTYKELTTEERDFFDQFLIAMRINFEAKNKSDGNGN